MFHLLVILSLLASKTYDVAAVTLDSTLLTQLGYNSQSLRVGLYYENITDIDLNAFKGYINLTNLELSYNALTKLDLGVFKDSINLQSIDLSYNPLTQLTNTKKIKFSFLQTFNLYFSPLASLDSNVVNAFPNITSCYIFTYNQSMSPLKPNQISAWKKLRNLALTTKNQISLTKAHFNGLSSLETLFFEGSNIKTIETNTLLAFPNLISVTFYNNALTSFEYLQIPPKLDRLNLSGNKMNYFMLSRTMGNLKYLFLNNNLFRSFKSMDFSFLANLTDLSLSDNPHAYPNEIGSHLKYLVNLKYVYLSNLSISNIDSNFFKKNTNLNTINLSNNKINAISYDAFNGMTNLANIYLNYNNLTQLDNSTFAGCNNLQYISLYGNPNLQTSNLKSLCPKSSVNCQVLY